MNLRPQCIAFLAALCVVVASASAQTPADIRVVEAASARDAYWAAADGEDYTTAYSMLTPGMQALETQDQFSANNARTKRDMGRALERRVMRTTVYDNPPSAPVPGVYIAFDFVGRFERADRNCRYIILHQSDNGGPFRVTRSDQSFLPNDATRGSGQSPDEVWAQMAAQFCPGWQPSWAIQPPV